MKRRISSIPLIFILLAVMACNGVVTPPDMNALGTSIAETVMATLTSLGAPATATDVPLLPSLTFTPDTPTLTPTQTLIPTSTYTVTPLVPQVSVSVATNCRTGPGKAYPIVGGLQAGDVVQVFGRDPKGDYWYIHNPSRPNKFCWIWGEYATVTGNIGAIPVFTPPPTPTATSTPTATATFTAKPAPKFTLAFSGLEICKAKKRWWVEFDIKNTGAFPLRSVSLTVQDVDKNVTKTKVTDGFESQNGCNPAPYRAVLQPGKSVVIVSDPFAYNLKGRNLRAWIVLCVQTGQGAPCVQKTINFTP